MRTREIIAGLQILMPFYTDQNGYHTGANLNEIYAYPTDKPISDVALDNMIGFGWHQDYEGRNNDERYTRKEYRPDQRWVCTCI